MRSNQAVYINIIKYPNQLKLDYKHIKNGSILKADQAVFIGKKESLGEDVVFKVKSLQKEEKSSFISTILNTNEQFICKNNQLDKYNKNEYEFIELYNQTTIVVPKNIIFETKHYFEKIGVDYIFSPFVILTHYLLDNPSKNSIVALIISNFVYIMITDSISSSLYAVVKKIKTYEDIKKSSFYNDELEKQKLFDEMYSLELQEILSHTLEEFYKQSKNGTFAEKVNILYTQKQLDQNDIENYKEHFIMDVEYHPISIENYMYELVNSKNKIKSFVVNKTGKKENLIWYILSFVATIITITLIYFTNTPSHKIVQEKSINIQEESIKTDLIDHKTKNSSISKLIKDIFNTIPYNVVLNELVLDESDSIMVCDFLEKDTFVKIMQTKMLELYKDTNILFEESNGELSPIYLAIIKNTEQLDPTNNSLTSYKQTSFSYSMMQDIIKKTIDPKWQIIYIKTENKDNFNSHIFELNINLEDPSYLFELIDNINELPYSISIVHPIKMVKNPQTKLIDIKIYLSFNQTTQH